MKPRIKTRLERLEDLLALPKEMSIDEKLEKSNLSRSSLKLCKEKGCEHQKQDGSSRCKNHSKQV